MIVGKIEKNIEYPEYGRGDRRSKYPWAKMKPGDSILFTPQKSENPYRLFRTLANSSKYFGEGQFPNWKFRTRRQPDNSIRIWRIE